MPRPGRSYLPTLQLGYRFRLKADPGPVGAPRACQWDGRRAKNDVLKHDIVLKTGPLLHDPKCFCSRGIVGDGRERRRKSRPLVDAAAVSYLQCPRLSGTARSLLGWPDPGSAALPRMASMLLAPAMVVMPR